MEVDDILKGIIDDPHLTIGHKISMAVRHGEFLESQRKFQEEWDKYQRIIETGNLD